MGDDLLFFVFNDVCIPFVKGTKQAGINRNLLFSNVGPCNKRTP